MKNRFLGLILAVLMTGLSPAVAQQFPTVPAQSVIGRIGIPGDSGPSQAIPFPTLASQMATLLSNYSGPVNTVTTNYQLLPSDCGGTVQVGTGSTGFLTLTIPSISGFLTTCSVVIVNGDTTRAKTIVGLTLPYADGCNCLWPGQTFVAKIINGAWTVVFEPGRWHPTGAVTCYVDAINGNDNNDCLAAGAGNAVQTLFQAAERIANHQWDLYSASSTTQVTFQLADNNTCTGSNAYGGLHLAGPGVGHDGNASYVIQGNAVTPANVCINDQTSISAIATFDGAILEIKNLKMQSASGIPTVQADENSIIRLEGGIILGGSGTSADFFIQHGSQIFADAGYTIAGSSNEHVITTDGGGWKVTTSLTVTCTASPAYNDFILLQRHARQYWVGTTFSGCGSVTGTRFYADGGSQIETGGVGANFFPGNSGGALHGFSNYDGATDLSGDCTLAFNTVITCLKTNNVSFGTLATLALPNLPWSATAPSVASGFCSSPSISNNNGTAAFTITIGSSCGASTGVLTMPAAAHGWKCDFADITTPTSNAPAQTGPASAGTTTVNVTNYVRTTGVAGNWTAADVIAASCTAY